MSEKFKPGDKVIVNHGVVATIVSYNTQANRLVYEITQGGGTNTVYGHISNTHLVGIDLPSVADLTTEEPAVEPDEDESSEDSEGESSEDSEGEK